MDRYLKECFRSGNIQLFVGAGLSEKSYPNADELRNRLLDDPIYFEGTQTTLRKALRNSDNVSLEDAAEFYELYQSPDALLRIIKGVYGTIKRPAKIHEDLWKLPSVRWIYTTNFDCLVEDALGRPQQPPEVITRGADIRDVLRSQRVVFKPHGCARLSVSRQEFVITRNDYLNYSHRHTLEMLKTLYDISTRAFLFLGYSLRDVNMRHIITEASRIANVRSYAVLPNILGPESRYWQGLGVTLIKQSANDFVAEILRLFPAYESEWDKKVDVRVQEKQEIASKALFILRNAINRNSALNVIIDAGSTTLWFVKALAEDVVAGTISWDKVRIVTNSPLAMEELTPAVRRSGGKTTPTIIGGPLRFDTRAYTPDAASAKNQLLPFARSGVPTLMFMGVTALSKSGLKTKTQSEVAIKKAFIDVAQEIYVLADHAKIRSLSGGHVFSPWDRKRMTIVTDRVKEMEDMMPFCKAIC